MVELGLEFCTDQSNFAKSKCARVIFSKSTNRVLDSRWLLLCDIFNNGAILASNQIKFNPHIQKLEYDYDIKEGVLPRLHTLHIPSHIK